MGPDLPIIMDLSNVYGFKYPDFTGIHFTGKHAGKLHINCD